MTLLIQQIIDELILKKAFLNNHPKPGVIFLAIDSLFNNPVMRKIVSKAVTASIDSQTFDAVASIASRGYLFSGMIANQLTDKGEHLVQKVKVMGDTRYVQLNTTTEYSSDALQVLKHTIQPGKKYLLTDDLIATGGSVKTAIQLIRQCGGQVDTVFVMTELTDFNARAILKQAGVELISLLKFTQGDLEKLLVLQRGYEQSPFTPITYRLTHHVKGEQALIKANNALALTVHLASRSSLKIEATQEALQVMLDPLPIKLRAHDAQSGVNEQPFGYDETIKGATTRLQSLKDSANDMMISMESGIRYSEEDQSYYDFVHVMVNKGEMIFSQSQDCCKIPMKIINAMRQNESKAFLETWGETAQRMGLAKQSNNPHQEQEFGGISRTDYLLQTLCKVLGQFKEKMIEQYPIDIEDQDFSMNRLVELSDNKPASNYAKKGIFFTSPKEVISKPINFYNHGCPIEQWNIDPEKVARNKFQIFATGDAFSVISPDITISGANITVHVGTEHARYSPLVLMQEALQLCRCAYEHGARSITIALPDQFHPVVHFSDFNSLILRLFEASGASKVYFYDNKYTGKLDETNLNETLLFTLSNHSGKEHYKIDRQELNAYLQPPQNPQVIKGRLSLDHQIMHFSRKRCFERELSVFFPGKLGVTESLCGPELLSELKVPEIKVQPHVLLCGSANKPLAKKIAESLHMRGEMVRLYSIHGEGEQAQIPDDASICGAVVTIIQSTRPNPDSTEEAQEYQRNGASSYLFTAAMIARQAHLRGAETINLINPYQFNARSDKAEDNHKGKTGAYIQQNGMLLAAAGVNHVITAECHDNHTMTGSYTGKKIRGSAISAISIITTKLANEWLNDPEHPMQGQLRLVTPDAGAAKRTKELTEQLQSILGSHLCQTRVLGEKQRDSHRDDSALISSLNSGNVSINPNDKYLITDDEITTGNTVCQAVDNLCKNGAKDVAVVVVYNNMPLDWLSRQLCLARFFYLGVTELHFSDMHEMGTLAKSYEDLITRCSQRLQLPASQIEDKVVIWFKDNISKNFADQSDAYITQEFIRFKSKFDQFELRIRVHSLVNEFANKVTTKPYMANPHAFAYKVNEFIKEIQKTQATCIVAFAGASLPAASAVALELSLPLQVIPQTIPGTAQQKMTLPENTFALIGTPSELTLKTLEQDTGYNSVGSLLHAGTQSIDGELVIVTNKPLNFADAKEAVHETHAPELNANMRESLAVLEDLYSTIKRNPKLKDCPVKLLGIGNEGHVLAGQLCHLLNKNGHTIGIAAADRALHTNSVVYTGKFAKEILHVDRNSLGMGDVSIAVARDLTEHSIKAINNLASNAKIHCPYFISVSNQGQCQVSTEKDDQRMENSGIYTAKSGLPLFSQPKVHQETLELGPQNRC
ncbi:MAG: DUF84 family protein [Legionellales bacterium]